MLIFSINFRNICWITSGKFSSKFANFGQQFYKTNELLKIKLQTCENVWRNLAEFLNAERCKSVSFSIFFPTESIPSVVLFSPKTHKCKSCRSRQELSNFFSNDYLVFICKIWRRYSRERASQSLPKMSQTLEKIRKT